MTIAVPSRGELESAICKAVISLEKETTGRGPTEARALLLDDLVVIRLRGALTPAEEQLAAAEPRGRLLLRQSRVELTELNRPRFGQIVRELLGLDLVSLHNDICAGSGDRVIVITLSGRPTLPPDC